MSTIAFFVEGEPVPKGRPRVTRSGHTYTPARTVSWEALIAGNAMVALHRAKQYGPFPGPVSAFLKFYGARANADSDNLAKSALDGLNKIIYRDDSQVESLRVERIKLPHPEHGKSVYIEITELRKES